MFKMNDCSNSKQTTLYIKFFCIVISVVSFILFVQSTPMNLKWTALSLRHCSGNRINASNDKITEV